MTSGGSAGGGGGSGGGGVGVGGDDEAVDQVQKRDGGLAAAGTATVCCRSGWGARWITKKI